MAYNAAIGRWMQRDPLGLGPDDNDYRTEANSATDEVDPSGLESSGRGFELEVEFPIRTIRRGTQRYPGAWQKYVDEQDQRDNQHTFMIWAASKIAYASNLKTVVLLSPDHKDTSQPDRWWKHAREDNPTADIYQDVNSLQAIADYLYDGDYPDGSIRLLIIGAHGIIKGGTGLNGTGTMPFTPEDLRANPELTKQIAKKLAPGAIIDFQCCWLASEASWGRKGMQDVANLLHATVVANTNPVDDNGIVTCIRKPIDDKSGPRTGKWVYVPPE